MHYLFGAHENKSKRPISNSLLKNSAFSVIVFLEIFKIWKNEKNQLDLFQFFAIFFYFFY